MRQLTLLPALFVSALAFAQAPQKPAAEPKPDPAAAAAEDARKDLEERIRTQGAAGGTRPIGEREKAAADAGAGPHLKSDSYPAPRDNEAPKREPK